MLWFPRLDVFNRGFSMSPPLQPRILQDEEHGQDVHEPCHLAELACGDVQDRVGNDAEGDALGDGIGERHDGDADERRNRFDDFIPGDLHDLLHHQKADDDERGRRREARHGEEERREEERDEEEERRRHRRQPRASALDDACRGLNVGRDRRRAETGTDRRAAGVRHECALDARQPALLVEHVSARRAADQCAERIEEVDEEEGEHDDEEIEREDRVEVKLQECRRD